MRICTQIVPEYNVTMRKGADRVHTYFIFLQCERHNSLGIGVDPEGSRRVSFSDDREADEEEEEEKNYRKYKTFSLFHISYTFFKAHRRRAGDGTTSGARRVIIMDGEAARLVRG